MIVTLPMPDELAVPLPAGARLVASVGEQVRAGQKIADGGGADILAPADGRVGEVCRRPLAGDEGRNADCIILYETLAAPPLPVESGATFAETLKKAGIVGLGGGGFPAGRKWRPRLRLFIANAVESEPLASCDKALLAESGDAAFAAAAHVGGMFADSIIFAVAGGGGFSHPLVKTVEGDYALGNERLLIERLTGVLPPRGLLPADAGVVCFNIGTVLAMDAALKNKTPMLGRVVTVHHDAGAINIRTPFGATVGDIRRFLGAKAEAEAEAAGAVVGASTIVLRLDETKKPAAMPCIRCGACEPVCPARLSPLLLHALAQDERWEEMEKQRLPDCLECRRCDEVCPSRIPLASSFAAGKRRIAAQQTERTRREQWRTLHERHLSRQGASRHYLDGDALKSKIAAVLNRPPPA